MNFNVLGTISTLHQNSIAATPQRIADEMDIGVADIMQSLYDLEQQGLVYATATGAFALTDEGLTALYHG